MSASSALDTKARRAVSDLLRHLDHPNRLRQNRFAAGYFTESTREADLDALRRLKRSISDALVRLTPRQRIIIEQCDLGGELNSTVARRLSISEAYFYRERQRALSVIGRHLVAASHGKETLEVLPDALTAAFAGVAVLEQVGDTARAVDVLEQVAPSLGDVVQRSLVHCRLAGLYSEAGLGEKAVVHCGAASTLADQAGVQSDALQLDAAAAFALAKYCAGDEVAAEPLARTLLVPLRGAVHNAATTSTRESFIAMAVLLAEREIERGRSQEAMRLCDEALSVVRSDDKVRRNWEYRVLRWRAAAQFHSLSTMQDFARAVDQSVGELQDLLALALRAGQIAEAIASAAQLASFHRLMHRADRAIKALAPLLITVKDAGARCFVHAFLELAAANVQAGRFSEALPLIQRIQNNPRAPALARAISLQFEADAALRSGCAERALSCATEAAEKMLSLNRFRFVGAASRYQALAFEALGKRGDALTSIALSTAYLREFGNLASFLRAQADAARLSGDRHRALTLAHKLSAVGKIANRKQVS